MAIATSQIEYRLAAPGATAGDTVDGVSGQSLGGWVSRSLLPGGMIGNLFPNVTALEYLNNQIDYQCLFVVNRHPTYTLGSAVAWLPFQRPGGSTIDIAPDDVMPMDLDEAMEMQATVIPDKNTAPGIGAGYSLATSKDAGIELGDIGPNQAVAIWLRRSGATDGVVVLGGTGVLKLSGVPNFTTVPLSGEGRLFVDQRSAGLARASFYGYGALTTTTKTSLAYVAAPTPDSVILRVEGYSPA